MKSHYILHRFQVQVKMSLNDLTYYFVFKSHKIYSKISTDELFTSVRSPLVNSNKTLCLLLRLFSFHLKVIRLFFLHSISPEKCEKFLLNKLIQTNKNYFLLLVLNFIRSATKKRYKSFKKLKSVYGLDKTKSVTDKFRP